MTSFNLVGLLHLLSLYYVLNPTLNLCYVVLLPLGLKCFMLSHHPSLHFTFQTNCDMLLYLCHNFVLWFSFLFLRFSLIIHFGLCMDLDTNCELLLFVLLELRALVFSRTLALCFYISLCYVFQLGHQLWMFVLFKLFVFIFFKTLVIHNHVVLFFVLIYTIYEFLLFVLLEFHA
jgi:hypothetical protein